MYACAALVQVVRLLLSKRVEWDLEAHVAHGDFAVASMSRRGVPEPAAMAYLREDRRA